MSVTKTPIASLLSPAPCKSARGLLNISQEELASLASISIASVRRFKAGTPYSDYPIALLLGINGPRDNA